MFGQKESFETQTQLQNRILDIANYMFAAAT